MRMPPPILLSGLTVILATVSGCNSGQRTFFEPIVGDQHVAFVTPSGASTGPGNPVFLPPNFRETLTVNRKSLYLSGESWSLIAPTSVHSSDPNRLLFVEARVHLIPGTFEQWMGDHSFQIEFKKVVIDEVIRVETYREGK